MTQHPCPARMDGMESGTARATTDRYGIARAKPTIISDSNQEVDFLHYLVLHQFHLKGVLSND